MMQSLPRHQCLIYEGPPSLHLQSLALTMIGKLKGHRRCLYLNSPDMVESMRKALGTLGLDHTAEVEKGSLILTSSQDHLLDGKFDADKMMDLLATTLKNTLNEGYVGLWATGDMTWELGPEKNFAQLFDYENRLEAFMKENLELSGVCQYHRDTIPLRAIKTAIHTHPAIYINDTLTRINPDHQQPAAV